MGFGESEKIRFSNHQRVTESGKCSLGRHDGAFRNCTNAQKEVTSEAVDAVESAGVVERFAACGKRIACFIDVCLGDWA